MGQPVAGWKRPPASAGGVAGKQPVIPAKAGIRAPTRALYQRGASPRQGEVTHPVTESNCVAERRGGEQLEVKEQSAG